MLDAAGALWGIRVHRYEIKNLTPPETVKNAMEKQVNAERERRAILASSEGDKQAQINRSEGEKAELINRSEEKNSAVSTRRRGGVRDSGDCRSDRGIDRQDRQCVESAGRQCGTLPSTERKVHQHNWRTWWEQGDPLDNLMQFDGWVQNLDSNLQRRPSRTDSSVQGAGAVATSTTPGPGTSV